MIENEEKPIAMGLGKLASRGIIIAHKRRWKLTAEGFAPEIFRKVHVDYQQKILTLILRDFVVDDSIFDSLRFWENLPTEIKLVTYDGCGNPLYSTKFSDLAKLGHDVEYDYDSSGVVERNLKLSYSSVDVEIIYKPKTDQNQIKFQTAAGNTIDLTDRAIL